MNRMPICSASAAVRSLLPTRPSRSSTDGSGCCGALGFLDRLFEVVARQHVPVDERLAEPSRLVGQHRCRSPSAGCGLHGISA